MLHFFLAFVAFCVPAVLSDFLAVYISHHLHTITPVLCRPCVWTLSGHKKKMGPTAMNIEGVGIKKAKMQKRRHKLEWGEDVGDLF